MTTVAESDNVHALRPYTDDQALAFLEANGETKFSQVELAKRWKWSRRTVGRRLGEWEDAGTITWRDDGTIVVAGRTEPGAHGQGELRSGQDAQDSGQSGAHDGHLGAQDASAQARKRPQGAQGGHPKKTNKIKDCPGAHPDVPTHGQADVRSGEVGASAPAQMGTMIGAMGTEVATVTVSDAPPLAPAQPAAPSVPASATVRAHLLGPDLVAVPKGWVSHPIGAVEIFGYGMAVIIDVAVWWFSTTGLLALFPFLWPPAVVVLGGIIEGGKLVAAGILGACWRELHWGARLAFMVAVAGGMLASGLGVYNQLIMGHFGNHDSVAAGIERKDAEIEILIRTQRGVVADVDRRLGQIDQAIEKATALGRTNGALHMVEDSKKARTALQEERKREGVALASLESQRAQVTQQSRNLDAEAVSLRHVAEAIGMRGDSETLFRRFCLLIVLIMDPLAVALVCGVSSRRR